MERKLDYYGEVALLAQATGLDDRQVRRVLREADTVALDTVDRALINEGSTPLWALDYSEEDFQRAAQEISKREKAKA
jgi:3-hydroxyisobutyrate dehydrogenase-like beta-hydroxyacid dehydrogenase